MKRKQEINPKAELIGLFVTLALFLLISYLAQNYLDAFESYIGNSVLGMTVYVFIVILSIVLAPLSAVPLIPLATQLWGVVASALLNIAGWTIGAGIAFQLGRLYGERLSKHIQGLDRVKQLSGRIPEGKLFFGVLVLRMLLPVDVLSYALALSTKIKLRTYILATFLGVTPFAFVFASLGAVPFKIQFVLALVFALVATVYFAYRSLSQRARSYKLLSPKNQADK